MDKTEVCADAMTRLDDLATLAKSLNEESNQINTVLSDFEKRLGEMNLGIEAWARPWAFVVPGLGDKKKSRWSGLERAIIDRGEDGQKFTFEVLGYGVLPCPSDSKGLRYGLLVRTEHYQGEPSEDGSPEPSWIFESAEQPRPLLQASREIRLAALEDLEHLVEALDEEARTLLSSIEKGRKVVEKL